MTEVMESENQQNNNTLDLRDQIKKVAEWEGSFRRHYTMPRQCGATSFLINFANERFDAGENVIMVVYMNEFARHLQHNGLNRDIIIKSYNSEHDLNKFEGYRLDWVIIDNLEHLRRDADHRFMNILPHITKNYIRIDTI